MELQLPDEDVALLRKLAEREGRSMKEVLMLAIQERRERLERDRRVRAVIDRVVEKDQETLDRLREV